ncbi:vacuolar iron transporter homolog 2-like [Prosopis cineraria]|uniref:vacuolar iron transporter homolog 2-like n=1 Tax=Prosopis cineraria TaxID=364024 RepID=UPI00240F28B3|nr:vacuolar iron transporter homolog 2-like [Prosopis cineraria]
MRTRSDGEGGTRQTMKNSRWTEARTLSTKSIREAWHQNNILFDYGKSQAEPNRSIFSSDPFRNAISDIEAPQGNLHGDQRQENINDDVDYSQRAQWLRVAVLGANDGLLSTASLIMGVGAVRKDVKTMVLTGIAGLVAGACGMAIGEFVSVYSQYDIEVAQLKRERKEVNKAKLPNPLYAAVASIVAFGSGAAVPLLGAAFIKEYKVRLAVVVGVVSLALLGFGVLSAFLGKAPVVKSSSRVLIGGWIAMGITFGLTKSMDLINV